MLSSLTKIAQAHHIKLYFSDDLPPHIGAFADQKSQSIVINNASANYGAICYKIAHELGHLLLNNQVTNYKLRQNQLKNEQSAHQMALELVIPLYLNYLNPEMVNIDTIMHYFDLPNSLLTSVEQVVTAYFKNIS